MINIDNVYQYRHFILSSIQNEVRRRFARSTLGALWLIIHPLAQVAIYALILSHMISAKLPGTQSKYTYPIYLMAGMLGWTLFCDIFSRGVTLFIDQSNLIKKIKFPRVTLPFISVGTCLVNNVLLLFSILVIFVLLGHPFSFTMLWLVPITLLLAGFSISTGLVLGTINVFMRDIGHIIPIALQLLFWCTPIVYPIAILPDKYRCFLAINPLFPIIKSYQEVLVYNHTPNLTTLLPTIGITFCALLLCKFIYHRAIDEMVDAL